MFVDTAKITVQAGNGGSGVVSFRREKYIAAGGPDGGDGGRGGSVVLRVDSHMATLMDFRYQRKFVAASGDNGGGKHQSGKSGANLYIRVPQGTVVRDAESGGIMHDMSSGEDYVVAKGGVGGWGNQHFATPTRQAPRFSKQGLPGEQREIVLELKLLADVGLAGFPNVGKSTLLSVISSARPKIANYHFTTLQPNLGVVRVDEGESFVVADIPGIIEGASDGAGLGHEFLRHIDRCRLVVHVVDISGSEGRDPVDDFHAINEELAGWSSSLGSRPQLVVGNKSDIVDEQNECAQRFREIAAGLELPYLEISAATQQGVQELIYKAATMLRDLPPIEVYEPDYVAPVALPGRAEDVTIVVEDGVFILEGEWLLKIASGVNFDDYESRMWFEKMLRDSGIFKRLEKIGVEEGDTVSIYNLDFEYVK